MRVYVRLGIDACVTASALHKEVGEGNMAKTSLLEMKSFGTGLSLRSQHGIQTKGAQMLLRLNVVAH